MYLGNIDEDEIEQIVFENPNIKQLEERDPNVIINNEETEKKQKVQINSVEEKMDVTQGKLIIGLDVLENKPGTRFIASIYNVILGESATSKLFQNVREKASLAYSARSSYTRQKNNIFIRCGIEIKNYEKALTIIKEQLQAMRDGNFTQDDITNAKKYMNNGIKSIEETQDLEITYHFGQELSGYNVSPAQYEEEINKVTKQQIVEIAQKIEINTIYFLKNNV